MLDERLQKVQTERQNALNQSNSMYQGLLENNQNLYDSQLQKTDAAEKIQNDILDKQLANQTQKIEQQKQEAQKNYVEETKKAKNDYTSFINPYGYNAEAMASQGLNNSGMSETSKLGGWNTYQNRLANANKAKEAAILQYDNDINDARLNNDVQKAQNAYQKLQSQLGFLESYYTNKGNIQQNQLSSSQNLDNDYFNRYQTEYANIQNERAREEATRQWEEQMAFQKQQAQQEQANWEKEYALSKKKVSSSSGGTRSGGYSLSNGSSSNKNLKKSKYIVKNIFSGAFDSAGKDLSNQPIYTSNGKYYVYDSGEGDYIDVTSPVNESIKNNVCLKW